MYKICIYAICKNEEKFVKRWYESIKDADYICVLDTGSTDNTLNELKKLNIICESKIINPWRFDIARNESMNLIPKDTDICICLDLDEVILPGWREELLKLWNKHVTRVSYNYNWKLDSNNNPLVSFYSDKIHAYNKYTWIYPVHEILKYDDKSDEVTYITNNITINHYPDSKKSRNSYLKLLELSIKENPNNDRNMHYLGREYMYYKKWNKSINTLIKHLNLKTSTWKDERSASMRFISRCYSNLGRYEEARMWLNKAIKETPYLREPYTEMMILEYNLKNYDKAIKYGKKALKIKQHVKTYINEVFAWDETIYDILSICEYNLGNINSGLRYIKKAIKINPDNKRINENLKYFKIKN